MQVKVSVTFLLEYLSQGYQGYPSSMTYQDAQVKVTKVTPPLWPR